MPQCVGQLISFVRVSEAVLGPDDQRVYGNARLRASVGSTEASNGRLARVGVVGPTRAPGGGAPLISRGGRQGIGHQSDFPGGLLMTVHPVGYLEPVTGWILRLAMAWCTAPCDWL